jgi:predicted TIM-barrel fold metal-dependent hydrolase
MTRVSPLDNGTAGRAARRSVGPGQATDLHDFFDSMAPFPASALPLARDLGLMGRVLLGSDFPNISCPYARQVAGPARLGLGDEWLRAVCWDNPVAMFGRP